MDTHPPEIAVPAPRGAAEPSDTTRSPRAAGELQAGRDAREVRDQPGWLTLIEALDRFAAGLVARYEHDLTRTAHRADRDRVRRQLEHARALEATTAHALTDATRWTPPTPTPATIAAQPTT